MSSFGDRLKEIRNEKNMSQQELAERLGTSKQVISRYETGQRTPKVTIVDEYAKKLNVDLDYLLGVNLLQKQKPVQLDALLEGLPPERREFIEFVKTLNDEDFELVYDIFRTIYEKRASKPD